MPLKENNPVMYKSKFIHEFSSIFLLEENRRQGEGRQKGKRRIRKDKNGNDGRKTMKKKWRRKKATNYGNYENYQRLLQRRRLLTALEDQQYGHLCQLAQEAKKFVPMAQKSFFNLKHKTEKLLEENKEKPFFGEESAENVSEEIEVKRCINICSKISDIEEPKSVKKRKFFDASYGIFSCTAQTKRLKDSGVKQTQ
uniref:Uncharacterized protein n=1 Tax=Romanomermis culicivorax TaxID=13658 RepID=A0A915J5Q9_ROMCU